MNAALSTSEADLRPPPTCGQLFYGFLMLGLTAFGGALPLARRMVVEKHRWLSGSELSLIHI